jgi:tetratricopeptide (TPR) repeat protein
MVGKSTILTNDAILDEAERLIAAGRYDGAARMLAAAVSCTRTHLLSAAAALGRRAVAQALPHLRAILDDESTNAPALFLLGRAHLLSADAGAAVAVFERLAVTDAGLAGLDEALIGAYRRDARYQDAVDRADVAHPTQQVLFEKATAQAALGEAAASLATFDLLLTHSPHLAAGWYGSHAPALDLHGPAEAERRLDRAAACPGANRRYQAMQAAYDVVAGQPPRPYARGHAHLVDSAAALVPALAPGFRQFGLTLALLRWALAQATTPGLVLEFGVRRGTSITALGHAAGQEVHGFDSFEGLPEDWGSNRAGVLTTGAALPAVPANVTLHSGWFEQTLPAFLAAHPGPVRFANIDSDLYSSARTVLTALAGRIGPGTVLVFDEFVGNRTWRDDEYRAFHEYAAASGIAWRIIAVGLATKQVAIAVV